MDSTAATAALVAVGAAGLFEGTAIFLSAGDPVPAYNSASEADAKELLRDWRRMYPPAKDQQAPLVALGAAAAGVTAWSLRDSDPRAAAAFGVAAACNVAIFSYTLAKIMPLNRRLLPEGDAEKKEGNAGLLRLLQEWGKMHGVRTALGAVSLGAAAAGIHALLTKQ